MRAHINTQQHENVAKVKKKNKNNCLSEIPVFFNQILRPLRSQVKNIRKLVMLKLSLDSVSSFCAQNVMQSFFSVLGSNLLMNSLILLLCKLIISFTKQTIYYIVGRQRSYLHEILIISWRITLHNCCHLGNQFDGIVFVSTLKLGFARIASLTPQRYLVSVRSFNISWRAA